MFEKKVTEEQKKVLEKEAKKETKQNKKKEKKEAGNVGFTVKSLIIPFVLAAIAACLIYLVMQNATKNEILKAPVVCAVKDIDANTFIDAKSMDEYFEVKEVEAAVLPDSIYKSMDELPQNGFYVEVDLSKKQMVYGYDISEKDEVMDKYVEGTQLTSIAVNAFDNSVSGTVRHGDIVDVYALDPATEQFVLMAEDVYVEDAYDSSGNKLTAEYENENGFATATVFSVRVAPDEKEKMNQAISSKGIQLYLSDK